MAELMRHQEYFSGKTQINKLRWSVGRHWAFFRVSNQFRQTGLSGTCIRAAWTKPKGDRIRGGRWGWVGRGRGVGGKWRQLYLNNKKIFL